MADKNNSSGDTSPFLNGTTSRLALLRAMQIMSIPGPAKFLELTHEGRVVRDGIADGAASVAGMALGLPQRIWRFFNEHAEGARTTTPLKEQRFSQEWFEEKLKKGHRAHLSLTGRSEEPRQTGADHILYAGAQIAPVVGSFFVPGLQEISVIKIPKLVASVGAQSWIVESGMDGYDFLEDKFAFGAGEPKKGTSAAFAKAHAGEAPTVSTSAPAQQHGAAPKPAFAPPTPR